MPSWRRAASDHLRRDRLRPSRRDAQGRAGRRGAGLGRGEDEHAPDGLSGAARARAAEAAAFPSSMRSSACSPRISPTSAGSLRACVRARIPEAVAIAAAQLAGWGFVPRPRAALAPQRLNAASFAIDSYETGRPSPDAACRVGDARFLATAPVGKRTDVHRHPDARGQRRSSGWRGARAATSASRARHAARRPAAARHVGARVPGRRASRYERGGGRADDRRARCARGCTARRDRPQTLLSRTSPTASLSCPNI